MFMCTLHFSMVSLFDLPIQDILLTKYTDEPVE